MLASSPIDAAYSPTVYPSSAIAITISDINRHVDEEDRHKVMIFDGNQDKETIIINESGLYSLILSSKMPNAKKFKHWVTSEVLPQIRKTGGYIPVSNQDDDLTIMARAHRTCPKDLLIKLCNSFIQIYLFSFLNGYKF